LLRDQCARILFDGRNAKVTEQDLAVDIQQHVLRLYITMNYFSIMCVLQSLSDLLNIRNNGCEWQICSFGITLAQGPIRRVVHHEKWHITLDPKVEYAYNMRMQQVSNDPRFAEEIIEFTTSYLET
jgi:hypothetical protein